MRKLIGTICGIAILSACTQGTQREARMFPDYTDIAVPQNIAPLNFRVDGASSLKLEAASAAGKWTFRSCGATMRFPLRKWHDMLRQSCGDTIRVQLTAKMGGKAADSRGFWWAVREEKIDRYVSYRLIEPAYEVWNMLSVEERCTENFRSRLIADNQLTARNCMNCHTSNRADIQTTFLHARSKGGATIYQRGGTIRKIDTSSDSTAGPAVYGEISKDGRYGIFTTADILNGLHSSALERFEVFDASSDLILIDFENNTITDSPLVKGPEYQETFPCWSADGRKVYFCRSEAREQPSATKDMHYDLYSISFDPGTGKLGDKLELVFDAAAAGKSVSLLKCSPDGRRLLMCVSDYGTFPIWHSETDLWMLDLGTGEIDTLPQTNGAFGDSYHCWSGSGSWICWASKRDDRVYGRPYFAYVSPDGKTGKPFVLPQRNPSKYLTTFKSYNIPELYDSPEAYGSWDMRRFYRRMEAEKLQYTK